MATSPDRHPMAQARAGLSNQMIDLRERQAQAPGDLLVGEPFEIFELERPPLFRGHARERARDLGRAEAIARSRKPLELRAPFEGPTLDGLPSAPISRERARDGVEPRGEPVRILELAELPIRPQERVLRDVLGLGLSAPGEPPA